MSKHKKLYESLCIVKVCKDCGVERPMSEFKINNTSAGGRIRTCRDCMSIKKYNRIRRLKPYVTKSFEYPDGTKLCTQCNQVKPKSDFRSHYKKTGKLYSRCFVCQADSERMKNYGITGDEYRAMLLAQGGVCKICNKPNWTEKFLYVDHCHDTGKIRGILCHNCNAGIGLFKDNVELLLLAAEYVKNYGKINSNLVN